ncbi:hypothetical protein AYO44_07950 [Planctomycetaceae bacterium SCGC AG-212-F19]|nr:hypothetical protein AYO44_07950 [Planctomycetaceae bacterium SCGC AG-212-F19]
MIAILLCAISPALAHAGVYSTVEPIPGPLADETGMQPMPLELFRSTLGDRIGLLRDPMQLGPTDPPLPESTLKRRQDYETKAAALTKKVKAGSGTIDDQVNLSAYLIGLGKFQDAIHLLEPVARGEGRANFMVLSNLATAYQLAGQPERVPDYLQLARSCWPEKVPGMSDEQLKFYRQADRLQLRLVLVRKAEAARQPAGVRRAPDSVDALFGEPEDPIKFVGETGQYEAGKIAAKQKSKLPKDGLALVQQLVLWLPDDTRLYWLLGEMLNADGQIPEAYTVLDECVGGGRRYDAAELKEHRRILQEGLPKPPPPPPLFPDMQRAMVVAGGAVLVIGLLGYLQIRELRRRRS